jgi:SAM-dependent methyltransferase
MKTPRAWVARGYSGALMVRLNRRPVRKSDWMALGAREFQAGRFMRARQFFEKAHRTDPRNAGALISLARADERIGYIDEAITSLTRALRLDPDRIEAARVLSRLARQFALGDHSHLDAYGLKAALAIPTVDGQRLAELALAHLRDARGLGQTEDGDSARLLSKRTSDVLKEPLLHAALASGANKDPAIERLLTTLRRALLLEVEAERFADRDLFAFGIALVRQCQLNEHVFAVGADEHERLAELHIDQHALISGDPEAGRILLLRLLYQPLRLIAETLSEADCAAIRPRMLGEMLAPMLDEDAERTRLGALIPTLGDPVDPVSRRVAAQYEASPYPRWRSLHVPNIGAGKTMLSRYFPADRLGFMDDAQGAAGPDVLIAGAGTGQHAIASALSYGPGARVDAIDLSRASLAYGAQMARRLGVANIRFAAADILGLEEGARYDIIEAVGVLHHMADPMAGWRKLLGLLRPDGLMMVGLYSARSRKNLAVLRDHPAFPGPGCSDEQARAFRAVLMREAGHEHLLQSQDFYTLSAFRDLVLHEHEAVLRLEDIEAFLDENGLAFAGFVLPAPIRSSFAEKYPQNPWPGRLSDWAAYERKHPRTFEGMYNLWCARQRT